MDLGAPAGGDGRAVKGRDREARKKADWGRARAMAERGGVQVSKVEATNNGGIVVRFGALQGFIPLSQLDPARIQKGAEEGRAAAEVLRAMVGGLVSSKVLEADEARGRLVLSEKAALWAARVRRLREGATLAGRVGLVTDFGAFVDLAFPDGTYPISGLVHVSEISWDPVADARDAVAPGDEVKVKVIGIDRTKLRVALSMKALEADPLLETLDTLMPALSGEEEQEAEDARLMATPLAGLDAICRELAREEGIVDVTLGRQALEKRVVSQDLELWLSNVSTESGSFTLLARAGRQVQEVHVMSTLSREQMKAAVYRVTGRVE